MHGHPEPICPSQTSDTPSLAGRSATARESGLAGVCPICSQDEPELREQVDRIIGAGLDCRTWGVGAFGPEGEANVRRAASAGAQGTTVDWPARAQAMLQEDAVEALAARL